MNVPCRIDRAVVVGKLRIGNAHLAKHALKSIHGTGGDGNHRDVALRMIGRHVQRKPDNRIGHNRLRELPTPLASLDDNCVAGVYGHVAYGEGSVCRGVGEADHTGWI